MAGAKQALIVEDNQDMAAELESLLTEIGFKVTTIQEPEKVAPTLECREYEIALMNMTLPGMNWRKTFTTIKNTARTTTILSIKQTPDEDDIRLALNAGSYAVFARPLTSKQLTNLLQPRNDGMFIALR
jgi:DNA-binding response OmpR family regulator